MKVIGIKALLVLLSKTNIKIDLRLLALKRQQIEKGQIHLHNVSSHHFCCFQQILQRENDVLLIVLTQCGLMKQRKLL